VKVATAPKSLAGRIEVREILDRIARERGGESVSKQRVHVLEGHADFPAPVDVLRDGHGRPMPVWNRAEIEDYGHARSMAAGRPAAPADAVKG